MANKVVSTITVGLDKGQTFEGSSFDKRMLCWKDAGGELAVFVYIHDYDKARELRDHLTRMIEEAEAPANDVAAV